MDIQHISAPSDRPDAEGDDLIVVVDNQTLIKVRNYGTGEYLWKVHANSKTQDNYNPHGTIEDIIGKPEDGEWFTAAQSFGPLATWWEPKTWAHAVMNVINNQ